MSSSGLSRAVFLDRDGVINETIFRDGKPRAPDLVEDFRFFPGVREAVADLKAAGFLTIVVTNQPDVARGWQTRDRVEAMNQIVSEELRVDSIQVCYHVEADACPCRKPKPGMLLSAGREWNVDFSRSYMIGDRYGDVEAGLAAGCTPILVGPGDQPVPGVSPSHQVDSLREAVNWILGREREAEDQDS